LEGIIKDQQELLVQIRDREQELERVHEYMNDLQRINFIYQPVKDDFTDKKVAEFINNNHSHGKASLFFVREQEGIYTYGKKRLFIKVENDQVIVRVGGGYEKIDQFIESHCPFEVRKK
jgi:esterase/lipase